MTLAVAQEVIAKTLSGKQDPDEVHLYKQWDEFGRLKGYTAECKWDNYDSISFDMTDYYTRIIGTLDNIPNYIAGKHQ